MILASSSPHRRELLSAAGVRFDVVAPAVPEARDGDPMRLAARNAEAKARAVRSPDAIVIAADQVLSVDGRPHGKPAEREAARAILAMLAGRSHELVTAVAVAARGRVRVEEAVARLTMRPLDEREIDRYLDTGEWEGCAGAYRIEGRGVWLFSDIEGDITGVRGLPLLLLGRMLREEGLLLP